MRIVEKDFVLDSLGDGHFNLYFIKRVTKEDGTSAAKLVKPSYGCTLTSAIKKIIHHRVNTMYESENPCLLEYLQSLDNVSKQFLKLLHEG